jgi:hypothetical protein
MDKLLQIIEKIFYTNLIGEINLYMVFANVFKYLFVIIVLYFVYTITRMIYLDIGQLRGTGFRRGPYLQLITRRETLRFHVQNIYPLKNDNIIGRGRSADVQISSPFLSKEHAHIFKEGGIYYLEDLHSANGTYLNGEPVGEPVIIYPKDIVSLVDVEFIFMSGEGDG